jgi:NarL family two-component system response regulator LiaR
LIDDQILFRVGLIGLFRSTDDFVVIGPAGSVHQGKELALLYKPDIVLIDFSLPDGTGLDATRAIIQHLPDCKIIFLTVYETDENLFAALHLGAMGYMLKNITSSYLLSSLRALERGEKSYFAQDGKQYVGRILASGSLIQIWYGYTETDGKAEPARGGCVARGGE